MLSAFNPGKSISAIIAVIAICITLGIQSAGAQGGPLTLGEIMTGLQSKSGGFSQSEKNAFITKSVLERGVTFRLTNVIQKELQEVGASDELLRAIAAKTKPSSPPPVTERAPPRAVAEKLWIDQNVVENGLSGVMIHARFNVYNLKGVTSELYLRFKNQFGQYLISSNKLFSNQRGELAVYRKKITPAFTSTVYDDIAVFLPYNEINLPVGDHDLVLDANLLFNAAGSLQMIPVGDLAFKLNYPAPSVNAPGAKFDSLWVEYNKQEGGQIGMTIHTKFTASNLKDVVAQLAIGFYLENGERLMARADSSNKSLSGQLTLYKSIKPAYASAAYNDLSVFIPYSEFDLAPGQYILKMHADLMFPNGTLIRHFDEKAFRYSKQ